MCSINPLNTELNPICHMLALLGAHPILHIGRIWVKTASKVQVHLIIFSCICLCISCNFLNSKHPEYIKILASKFYKPSDTTILYTMPNFKTAPRLPGFLMSYSELPRIINAFFVFKIFRQNGKTGYIYHTIISHSKY